MQSAAVQQITINGAKRLNEGKLSCMYMYMIHYTINPEIFDVHY